MPKLAIYKGTVWATWDKDAPDFLDLSRRCEDHLDQALDCRDGRRGRLRGDRRAQMGVPGELEVRRRELPRRHLSQPVPPLGRPHRHRPERRGRQEGAARQRILEKAQHVWVSFPEGHGVHSAIQPESNEYIESFLRQSRASSNISATASRSGSGGWATRRGCCRSSARSFPTRPITGASRAGFAPGIRTARPQTEGWRFFLVDADAPAEVKDYAAPLLHALLGSRRDDRAGRHGELAVCHRGQHRGTIARRYPFNYQQSLGAWTREHALGGTVSLQVTEEIARGYYRRWKSYMGGGDWDELLGGGARLAQRAAE